MKVDLLQPAYKTQPKKKKSSRIYKPITKTVYI